MNNTSETGRNTTASELTLHDEFKSIAPAINVAEGEIAIIAGPCSAETRAQTIRTATELARQGIKIFRAGLWKPRTRPGCFEGCGTIGLEWLAEVKERTGMLTATEIACPSHAELALKAGVDILWIGARTTTNPFAVQEIAQALSGIDIPMMVKNPANPDLDLWIGALQRLRNAGVKRLSAIHRGFSSYGTRLHRNPPQWRIPIELHRRIPSLQLICDPSHIGGKRQLIAPLSQQAIDLGFNGLIIESHCTPDTALSDSSQQITPQRLHEILQSLTLRQQDTLNADLTSLRQQIDQLDSELLEILAKRMNVALEIGRLKKSHNLPVLQPQRYEALMKSRVEEAAALGLDRDFTSSILAALHAESVNRQLNL